MCVCICVLCVRVFAQLVVNTFISWENFYVRSLPCIFFFVGASRKKLNASFSVQFLFIITKIIFFWKHILQSKCNIASHYFNWTVSQILNFWNWYFHFHSRYIIIKLGRLTTNKKLILRNKDNLEQRFREGIRNKNTLK